MRLDQRIQYALACTHYLCGLRDLIYVVSPLVFLITGVPAVRGATLGLFLWHLLPYWIAAQGAFWYAGRRETGLRGIIIGFGSFPALTQALLSVVLGRRVDFMVTSKQRRGRRAWAHLTVYVVALVCCFGGIWLAFSGWRARPGSVAITVTWVIYDIGLLTSFLWLGVSDLRFKDASERPRRKLYQLVGSTSGLMRPQTWIPALAGVAFYNGAPRAGSAAQVVTPRRTAGRPAARRVAAAASGFVVFSGLLLTSSQPATIDPVQFAVSQAYGQSPYLGLSLRYELLKTRPYALERQLCLPFTIIGRTQVIQDSFDSAWAAELSAQNQRPWITLQFGTFGAHGRAPLDASLPAIANGVQDANIERWARDIQTYGKPVYLTILLHVDRNWSVSSAVANGGIPQDVPRAWEHVQSIFKAAGDTNVAWVWAPADPAHDQEYAPPESTIDVVLQSMIRYPNTPWPDPAAVLSAVSARHPTKPLFVEVSANGDPNEKAAWLKHIVATVKAYPTVSALLYHEGAPDLHATQADNARWSLESDARSLRAMLAWQSLVPSGGLPCRSSPRTSLQNHIAGVPVGVRHGQALLRLRPAGR